MTNENSGAPPARRPAQNNIRAQDTSPTTASTFIGAVACPRCGDRERYSKSGRCAPCCRARAAAYHRAHPETRRQYARAYYAATADERRAAQRRYYWATRDERLAAMAEYREQRRAGDRDGGAS